MRLTNFVDCCGASILSDFPRKSAVAPYGTKAKQIKVNMNGRMTFLCPLNEAEEKQFTKDLQSRTKSFKHSGFSFYVAILNWHQERVLSHIFRDLGWICVSKNPGCHGTENFFYIFTPPRPGGKTAKFSKKVYDPPLLPTPPEPEPKSRATAKTKSRSSILKNRKKDG